MEFTAALATGALRAALRTTEAHRVSVAPMIIIGDRHRFEGVPSVRACIES